MAKTLMDLLEPEIKEREIMAALDMADSILGDKEMAIDITGKKFGMTSDEVKAIVEKNTPVAV